MGPYANKNPYFGVLDMLKTLKNGHFFSGTILEQESQSPALSLCKNLNTIPKPIKSNRRYDLDSM